MKILFTILALLYALSPYDILPDFFPGWGWLDDLFILFLLWRFYYAARRIASEAKGYDRQYRQDQGRNEYSHGSNAGEASKTETGRKDPYTVLGVDRGASAREIKQAYRALANKYHPDKVAHLGDEFTQLAEKRFKEIHGAYQELRKNT